MEVPALPSLADPPLADAPGAEVVECADDVPAPPLSLTALTGTAWGMKPRRVPLYARAWPASSTAPAIPAISEGESIWQDQ